MNKNDVKVGMIVKISRGGPRAARAKGIVIKRNDKSAKVETTEQFNSRRPGTIFGVPYELIEPVDLILPEMTKEQAKLWQKIGEIKNLLETQQEDPQTILDQIKNLVNQ